MAPILVLWDIDGTLIHSGGAGERALVRATRLAEDADLDLRQIDWAGRTDRHIAEMILEHLGRPVTLEAANAIVEAYLDSLRDEIGARQGTILPGIAAILEYIDRSHRFAQGLLTGNVARGAETKLAHFDLWRYFPFGAFADDAIHRKDLGPHALRKATAHHGTRFSPDRTFVIGDTPHDITCGKAIGAHTLAVATGKFTEDALREHQPTAVFTDLADTDAFFAVLEEKAASA